MTRVPVVIIGAGGFGREVHDVIEATNAAAAGQSVSQSYEVVGFLDDGHTDAALIHERGLSVLGPVSYLADLAADVQFVIAIGDGQVRRRLDMWASELGRQSPVVVHPTAVVGNHRVVMGPGTILCAGTIVTTNVRLGRHVHLNLGVTVGHDSVLGDYVTVNPNASVSGNAVLEESVNLGTCASVIQGRRVAARTTVGAGAVVARDLPPDVTAVGMPAVALRRRGNDSKGLVAWARRREEAGGNL
ncbi:acetyltransferase [Blastococcus sp. KM273128]|uniref:acetyltransferase n=1 Tax=Blastococcus sp. KM273128 TaxID=2570314 RepID=UPI001F3DB94E|nr:acetyltransferase [Blastococcus sp. KM273128]